MVPIIPDTLLPLLSLFATSFISQHSYHNFLQLFSGWILCPGRHTLTRVIQAADAFEKHHSVYYRFFSHSHWIFDDLGKVLVMLIEPLVPHWRLYVPIDDTVCRRPGPQIFGAAMHHDARSSNYGKTGKKKPRPRLCFGHRFVTLSLFLPCPWNSKKGWALPVLVRLYRSKKRCPEADYLKPSQLARQMIDLLHSWLPKRHLVVLGDHEYACQTVVKDLPWGVSFVGPIVLNAAFYAQPDKNQQSRGRKRKKGQRLLSPNELIAADSVPWQKRKLWLYGRKVTMLIKQQSGLWYRVAGEQVVRMVVTRDPKGKFEDRAFFTTDVALNNAGVLRAVARRWPLECCYRDVKQFLGLETVQNGWWRRKHGERRPRGRAGPTENGERGRKAVERTGPFALLIYSVVVIWYVKNGCFQKEIERARVRAPWYRHKRDVSFADMLWSLRREYWLCGFYDKGTMMGGSSKLTEPLENLAFSA